MGCKKNRFHSSCDGGFLLSHLGQILNILGQWAMRKTHKPRLHPVLSQEQTTIFPSFLGYRHIRKDAHFKVLGWKVLSKLQNVTFTCKLCLPLAKIWCFKLPWQWFEAENRSYLHLKHSRYSLFNCICSLFPHCTVGLTLIDTGLGSILPFDVASLLFFFFFSPLAMPFFVHLCSKCQPPPLRAGWSPFCCPSCVWSWSSTPAGAGVNVVGSRSPRRAPAPRPLMRSTTSPLCWWEARPARAWGIPAVRGRTPAAPWAFERHRFWTGKRAVWFDGMWEVWDGSGWKQTDCVAEMNNLIIYTFFFFLPPSMLIE